MAALKGNRKMPPVGMGGRRKGVLNGEGQDLRPSPLLVDMRTVWKAGTAGKHRSPHRIALAEFLVSKPNEFLKQLRDMEKEYRGERLAHGRRKREEKGVPVVKVAAMVQEVSEVRVEDLARRLLAEWGSRK